MTSSHEGTSQRGLLQGLDPSCVLTFDDKLRLNIVKVAVEPQAAGEWFRRKR